MSTPRNVLTLYNATKAVHVEKLLAKGGDIDKVERGITPLISAIRRKNFEVVDCLLKHGANPDHAPPETWKPIHHASNEGLVNIIELLVQAGVNINDVTDDETPLTIAAQMGHVDVVEKLLALGADVDKREKDGMTALMWASRKGHIDVVDRLLSSGASANTISDSVFASQLTPIMLASSEGHLGIVDRLVIRGADINMRDFNGKTALMRACSKGHADVVGRLLSLKADVDARDANGCTVLMKACSDGKIEIVKLLLEYNADTQITDPSGKKAIDLVQTLEIQSLLEEHEAKKQQQK